MRELALLEVEPEVNQAGVEAESLRQQLKLDLRKPRKFVKFASRCSIQPAINLAHSPNPAAELQTICSGFTHM
jgi:hypothetical protein